MSSMRKYQHSQKWYKPAWSTTIPLQRLWNLSGIGVQARDEKKQKPLILKCYQERMSLRALGRVFHVHYQSVSRWIKEHVDGLPTFESTLLPARPDDILEFDEAWSFVRQKINKRWLWTVMCRRTRQIIAFVIGNRSENTCRQLWHKIPSDYQGCLAFSDYWKAYQKVLPEATHIAVGKETGETAHMERWYCTLRQRQARYVRMTLSFSKSEVVHHMVTEWFIIDHHLAINNQPASLTL